MSSSFNQFFFRVNRSLHGYETKEADNFIVEYRATTCTDFGIKYLAPAIWNDIPAGIREAEHIGWFKVKLKKTFIYYFFYYILLLLAFFMYILKLRGN